MKKILSLFIALFLLGCGGGDPKKVSKTKHQSSSVSKDTATPAEQGGYGFEKLSKGLGYESYICGLLYT